MSEEDKNNISEEDKNNMSEENINNIIEKDVNNISEEKKQILKKCLKEYREVKKSSSIIIMIQ